MQRTAVAPFILTGHLYEAGEIDELACKAVEEAFAQSLTLQGIEAAVAAARPDLPPSGRRVAIMRTLEKLWDHGLVVVHADRYLAAKRRLVLVGFGAGAGSGAVLTLAVERLM